LSGLGVAQFPWDPKPEPQPTMANPPTVPSNAGSYQGLVGAQIAQPQTGLTMPQMNNNGPRIKSEPGLESPTSMQAPYQSPMPTLSNATTAQQRAAQHLQANYGARAAASISQIQSNGPIQPTPQQIQQMQQMQAMQQNKQQPRPQMTQEEFNQQRQLQAMHQQQRFAQGIQPQQQQQSRPPMTQEEYNKTMLAKQQHQAQAVKQQQNGLGGAQNDGAGDEVESYSVIKQFAPDGTEMTMGRIEIDGLIRAKIEAMGQSMEGGGLMLPLQQASTPSSRRQRKPKSQGMGLGGGDAPDDDDDDVKEEELDEDAINSDLDDPDDGLNEEDEEEEGMGHIMLCMYDKVQRVKNKWYVLPFFSLARTRLT
jgi:transcription initiation factor TFIIA large subunit